MATKIIVTATRPRRRRPEHKRNGIPTNENSILYVKRKYFDHKKITYKPFNYYFCNAKITGVEISSVDPTPKEFEKICTWEGLGCQLREHTADAVYRCPRCSRIVCVEIYL